jgi:hypothetical protein
VEEYFVIAQQLHSIVLINIWGVSYAFHVVIVGIMIAIGLPLFVDDIVENGFSPAEFSFL